MALNGLVLDERSWPVIKFVGGALLFLMIYRYLDYRKVVDVPVVGPGVRFTKWVAALRNVWCARKAIHEGYYKHRNFAFQIPTLTRMDIFLCDRQMTKEYYLQDEEKMSFQSIINEEFQFDLLLPGLHPTAHKLPITVMSKALSFTKTRSSKPEDPFFSEFASESLFAFNEALKEYSKRVKTPNVKMPAAGTPYAKGDWISIPCFPLVLSVMTSLTIKALCGNILCRDKKFLKTSSTFGNAVPRDGMILRCFPAFTRKFFMKFLTAPRTIGSLRAMIHDEIVMRRSCRDKNPLSDCLDYSLGWIDDHAAEGYNDWNVVDMMANTIFGALHSSSQLITHLVYELALRPEYVQPLRDEMEACFVEHGDRTKKALDSMLLMDSFMKETQRLYPLDSSALGRLVLKPYTFSNGLHVPTGSVIYTPNSPLFEDERFYPDPQVFDGYRFSKMRDDPEKKTLAPFTTASENSMHFGLGRHACPGRYMVADEIKLLLIYFLRNFDIAFADHGKRPGNVWFGKFMLPDMTARVWLRQRNDTLEA
ncbi:Ent-kaurene oxidase [Escovopsis weberi]|uniref:Cytochrome P450 monooxygenase janQ n=1 Tax=Escovopsis weberi TaxID=150374 RepID=JANQ_ESCWE|nr:Ent-kaurene oxidase [Escovopsis weberi]DAB41646.1 TPA_exp: cytochrome P450 monooxygenase [Escovopsis weberi]